MTYLLDVNVLIALLDPHHVHHRPAHAWFERQGSWASCPITENAVLRIVGDARYPRSPGVAVVAGMVAELCALPGHAFWPDDVSLVSARVERAGLQARQVTDVYLLALAGRHGGQLASFDRAAGAGWPAGAGFLHCIG